MHSTEKVWAKLDRQRRNNHRKNGREQPDAEFARIDCDVAIQDVDQDRSEDCKGEGYKTSVEWQHAANDLHQKDHSSHRVRS
jgi:hypothetical protein